MRRLGLNTSARRNLRDIAQHLYLQGVDRRSSTKTLEALGQQFEKLAALPGDLGRPRPELAPGLRSFAFRGYVIFFRYGDDKLEIVNVLSGRQDHAAHITPGE